MVRKCYLLIIRSMANIISSNKQLWLKKLDYIIAKSCMQIQCISLMSDQSWASTKMQISIAISNSEPTLNRCKFDRRIFSLILIFLSGFFIDLTTNNSSSLFKYKGLAEISFSDFLFWCWSFQCRFDILFWLKGP